MRIYDHYIYIIYHIYFQSFSCFCARGIGKKSIHQRWSHVEVYQLTGGRADGGTEMDPAPGKCPLVAKQLGLWFKGLLEIWIERILTEIRNDVLDEHLTSITATKLNLCFMVILSKSQYNCLAHAISVNPAPVLHPTSICDLVVLYVGTKPTAIQVITYSSAISSGSQEIWELRLQYLQHMRAVHVEGNLICYNSLMAGNGADGAWHLALHSLDAVKHQMKADIITSA